MGFPSKILVSNDRLEGIASGLTKAALIEHYTEAQVEVAEVIWDAIEEETLPEYEKANLIEAYVAADRQGLRDLLAPYQERIAWSEARVLWNRCPERAILQEVSTENVDLLIKPAAEHTMGDYIHTPLDWRLIREAPCPVLISKTTDWQPGGTVLAAVDVADEKHAQLSDQVLVNAQAMSRILDADLHVVSVYSDLGQSVNALQVALDYQGIKEDMFETRQQLLAAMLKRLNITDANVHILEGKAAAVIAHLANQLNPTITVMGTAARKGVGKLFIGNTAEDALKRLNSDVLTVRVYDRPE